MKPSQRCATPAAIGIVASALISISSAFADGHADHAIDRENVFSEVVIGKHMLCVDREEPLIRSLSSYQRILTGETIDKTGATVRTDTIYINPTTRDIVIVGISSKSDMFCITDVFKNVRAHHSDVLDEMEHEP